MRSIQSEIMMKGARGEVLPRRLKGQESREGLNCLREVLEGRWDE